MIFKHCKIKNIIRISLIQIGLRLGLLQHCESIDDLSQSLISHDDAFVSYSQHDAEWVEEILVPELESTQPPFALCLHKRDFQPGRWIVDNIIDSIEKSHRTLFVLSEHFVTSEWCRYELDFSHFRIVDEHNDSAVLVLLEPIKKETIPKRFCKLRKIMNSRTYLEWPEEEEKRSEFWSNLRAALQREEC